MSAEAHHDHRNDSLPHWVALLRSWSEINSGFDHADGLLRMLVALEAEFGRFPATLTRLTPAAGALAPTLSIRCRPEAKVQVLLSGHYDTVFGREHPFQRCAAPKSGILNGPGVADMKGGLVVMLAALRAFEASPLRENLGWEVLLNADEEDGSLGSRQHLLEAAGRHHLGLVFEPSPVGDDVVRSRKGTAVLRVVVTGQAAHSSLVRTEGRNAVVALSRLLVEMHDLNASLPGIILNVANCQGGGAVNVVPDHATAELHLRSSTQAEGLEAIERLRTLVADVNQKNGYTARLEGGFNRPPMGADDMRDAWIECLQATASRQGCSLQGREVQSASDANFFASAGLPTIDGLGVDGDDLHSDREHCRIDSIGRRAELVSRFLLELAEGRLPHPPFRPLSSR